MEASNAFLEENVTTYDAETDKDVKTEDVVYVSSGEALDMQEVFRFHVWKI